MGSVFLGFLLLCCVAVVNCEFFTGQGNKLFYLYNGARYEASESLHRLYLNNPSEAERRIISEIENKRLFNGLNSDVSRLPQKHAQPNRQDPTRDEINNSQAFNSYNPNKGIKPQLASSATNFHFPQPESVSPNKYDIRNPDIIPPQDTGFHRVIPKDRQREEYKGTSVVTKFAWDLFKNSNNKPNYCLSSLSPQVLLSYLAWVADSATRNEIVRASGYGSPNQIQTIVSSMLSDTLNKELQIATAFFVSADMRINQEFLEKALESADLITVDFRNPEAASRTINKWARQNTKGGLKLKEINYAPSTKMAMTGALYFKGKWAYTFENAKPGRFFSSNGPVEASMMNMKKKFHWGKLGNYAEWIAIPYESSDSMVIILPNENRNVDDVINTVSDQDMDEIMKGIDSESTNANVNVTLPKFRMESTTSLIEPLKKMGISTLFTPQADLSYLSDYDTVQVNNAQQQAAIEVNEEGTVFVAFTNLNVVALSFQLPVPEVEFNVNRPFIAMVANTKKKIPYVIAKISNPSS